MHGAVSYLRINRICWKSKYTWICWKSKYIQSWSFLQIVNMMQKSGLISHRIWAKWDEIELSLLLFHLPLKSVKFEQAETKRSRWYLQSVPLVIDEDERISNSEKGKVTLNRSRWSCGMWTSLYEDWRERHEKCVNLLQYGYKTDNVRTTNRTKMYYTETLKRQFCSKQHFSSFRFSHTHSHNIWNKLNHLDSSSYSTRRTITIIV